MKLVILVALVLSGCAAKPVSQMNYAEMRDLADKIKARCAAQGAGPGTPNWKDCATIESNYEVQSRERQQAAQDALSQNAGASLGQAFSDASHANAAYAARIPVYQPPMTVSSPTFNCTSNTMGETTTTTCR